MLPMINQEKKTWLCCKNAEHQQILLGFDIRSAQRRLTKENCDLLVKIPMHGTVESLNVSVATGIFLYEAARER